MVSTLAAAAVNVACLHLTIRWIGAQAASLALLLGFAACIVIRQAILKKETGAKFPFPFFCFPPSCWECPDMYISPLAGW